MDEEKNKAKTGRSRFFFAGLVLFLALAIFAVRLFNWQIVNGATWLAKANKTGLYTINLDATRGEILDADGNGLAVNQSGYAIQFNAAYMSSDTENDTIATLIHLLDSRNETWTDDLPIQLNADGSYSFIDGMDNEVATLESKDFLNVNSYATAADCMRLLIQKYGCASFSAQDARDIISVRYNMTKSGFSISSPYIFAPNVDKETIEIMSENAAKLPGAETKITTVRTYPDGSLMPHIVGLVGAISQAQYAAKKDQGYAYNDTIGKSGIESAFEDQLRGTDGQEVVQTDTSGNVESEDVTTAPQNGNTVYLTINSNIQKVANVALAQEIAAARANGESQSARNYKGKSSGHGEDCVAGAAVLLKVSDFSVLAASTFPSYDVNQYLSDADYQSQLNNDSTTPLVNRAVAGLFAPGSSFKPAVAMAALQEGAITNSTVIVCHHVYERFASSGYTPVCMGNHGPLTLRMALAKSCNIFFYETGYRTGISSIDQYAQRLGLGQPTGIEIDEKTGTLAGPTERQSAGGIWTAADTIQAAIGQSDNSFTPMQMATYAATIANNGVRLKTHIISKITDYTRNTVISETQPEQVEEIGVSQQNMNYVKDGMRAVVTSGTAAAVFSSYGIPVAGKTGTAQGSGSDTVWFIGFAPYDNPQVAVAVVLEHGATTMYADLVARNILDAYFYGKTVDANGNLVMSSGSSQVSESNTVAADNPG